jgi:membrane-bound lytic murein transglycosylase B
LLGLFVRSVLLAALVFFARAAHAQSWETVAFRGEEPAGVFKEIVEKLAAPADDHGAPVTSKELRALLADPRTKQLYRRELRRYATPRSTTIQNEEHKNYLKVFLQEANLKRGTAFMKEHEATLAAAETKYGVKRADIVSVLMWESNLGRITGKYLVVNTYLGQILLLEEVFAEIEKKKGTLSPSTVRDEHLKRLGRIKQKAVNFLVALLRAAAAKKVDPLAIRGSWAGAIGFPQFMPTSMRFAADGDGDGKIDLYTFPDAIFSVASYLEAKGYENDRYAALFDYNSDSEYVKGVMAFGDAIDARNAASAGGVQGELER